MLNYILCFAAGVAITAVIGLFEKHRLRSEAVAMLYLTHGAVNAANERMERDKHHINALRAEIAELTRVSDSTTH